MLWCQPASSDLEGAPALLPASYKVTPNSIIAILVRCRCVSTLTLYQLPCIPMWRQGGHAGGPGRDVQLQRHLPAPGRAQPGLCHVHGRPVVRRRLVRCALRKAPQPGLSPCCDMRASVFVSPPAACLDNNRLRFCSREQRALKPPHMLHSAMERMDGRSAG